MITVIQGRQRTGKSTLALALGKQLQYEPFSRRNITVYNTGVITDVDLNGVLILDEVRFVREIETQQGVTLRIRARVLSLPAVQIEYSPRGVIEIDDLHALMRNYKQVILVLAPGEQLSKYITPDFSYLTN